MSIEHNKKIVKPNYDNLGKCSPCVPNTRTLCCKQVVGITSFKTTHTKHEFDTFHDINCKSKIIYLLEYNLCKIQCVGKSEGPFNIRLKVDKDFTLPGDNCNTNAKFIFFEQLLINILEKRKFFDNKTKDFNF